MTISKSSPIYTGNPLCVRDRPTFAYQLAMYLTRNGADAPHMQAEINMFLYENGWKTMQEVKS